RVAEPLRGQRQTARLAGCHRVHRERRYARCEAGSARPVGGRYTRTPEEPMRVVVDFDLCESNALCMQAAPEVFEVRDDDFLYVLQENPPEELRAKVEEAVARCPKQAITLEG